MSSSQDQTQSDMDATVLQRLLKQGVAGLFRAQYQLLYVQAGLMQAAEKRDWDVMTAVETF